MLVANECETIAEFHKETGDSFYKAFFKLKLQNGTCYSQEAEIVAAAKHLIGILRLFGRKSAVEIVIYSCQCLGLIHIEFDGIEKQITIPALGDGFLRIIERSFIIQSLAQQQHVV